jgi:hypothetical protein
VVAVKALACELPSQRDVPLSRWSATELAWQAMRTGLVARISDTTVWRWLNEDAIRPWQHRSWIFPRDPDFASRAGRILDLYEGVWEGEPLTDDDFVLSTDEKTSIQARRRRHETLPTQPGSPMKVEHEYKRCGAWAYLAAWDVFRAKIFGRCEDTTGIEPFRRLVDQVMQQPPYRDARRVFWIADNGSSHRGNAAIQRLSNSYPNAILIHTPVHASWLNQIEIYNSIIQRKVLTPNDFSSRQAVAARLEAFERHYESIAQPFHWTFTRKDLAALLLKLNRTESPIAQVPVAA